MKEVKVQTPQDTGIVEKVVDKALKQKTTAKSPGDVLKNCM